MACHTSSREASGTWASTSPVAGLLTAIARSFVAPTHAPPTYIFARSPIGLVVMRCSQKAAPYSSGECGARVSASLKVKPSTALANRTLSQRRWRTNTSVASLLPAELKRGGDKDWWLNLVSVQKSRPEREPLLRDVLERAHGEGVSPCPGSRGWRQIGSTSRDVCALSFRRTGAGQPVIAPGSGACRSPAPAASWSRRGRDRTASGRRGLAD